MTDSSDLFTQEDLRKTYEHTGNHIITKNVIVKYSQNPRDVRDVALENLDLTYVKSVLDLGCGYGFFIMKLHGRLDKEAKITGIDIIENNKKLFLQTIQAIGYNGIFIKGAADHIRSLPSASYDLVIASYSLYFFPHLISEIARVLKPKGLFITITHSKYSLQEAMALVAQSLVETGLNPSEDTAILKLFRNFSLEDGTARLEPYFSRVERIVYENLLRFSYEDVGDCIQYLNKKSSLLFKEVFENYPDQSNGILQQFYQIIQDRAKNQGQFMLTKHDAIFRCYQ